MTNKLKESAPEIELIARTIQSKKDLLKDYISQLDAVKAIDVEIKELNAKKAAIVASDVECFTLKDEIKGLSKDFSKAVKVATKELSFKPAVAKAYFAAKVVSVKKIDDVKAKGNNFSFLDNETK